MKRTLALSAALLLAGFVFTAPVSAKDRIDCFEDCDTKMQACLGKCEVDTNGDPVRECRNGCAIDVFHPCLDHCPHPRTGLTPAQKRDMKKIEQEQKGEKSM